MYLSEATPVQDEEKANASCGPGTDSETIDITSLDSESLLLHHFVYFIPRAVAWKYLHIGPLNSSKPFYQHVCSRHRR